MGRIVTALALCALLIGGSVWSGRAVEHTIDAVVADIERGALTQAYCTWEQAQTLLGSLLLHSELDHADRLFVRVLAERARGTVDDMTPDLAELIAELRQLPALERPSWKNLL
ncbi:MAG: DUF4363 family protein [Eubacteriales bacterium]|nr:DUF4363 family protein [Eubacteriales bacterium]